jgi:hypothetical protein
MAKQRNGLTRAGDILSSAIPSVAIVPQETKDAHRLPKPAKPVSITPLETEEADKLPWPGKPHFENQQLSLFQSLLCNNEEQRDQLSNAIDLWDSVPRYSISRRAMVKQRINGRFLNEHQAQFQHRGRAYTRTIFPALVTDLDGVKRYFYPSATEELVEDALRKLAIEQQAGYFDQPNYRSGVIFSLYTLREELKKRGHSRSYQEIILALNILSRSTIEIRLQENGEVVAQSTYLPVLVAVSRARLRDDPKAKWMVQFHPLVTLSIDKVTYRQYNYHVMMSHSTQLARWLHKQLVLKYTFASTMNPFEMRYSTIKRDSGLLEGYARLRKAMDAIEDAFDELKKREIIFSCNRTNITGSNRKILDAVFKILPSLDFITATKAASKRLSLASVNAAGTSEANRGTSGPNR